jgi:peptidoglycan/LPS O-acetylase OafA/YrhL
VASPSVTNAERLEPLGRRTIGDALSLRDNSLNFLRLTLAVSVIASHSVDLSGYSWFAFTNRTQLGTIAVYGFFGISGYLIAGSAVHHGAVRYLWQRFLRIFPAFWICLIVTAFGFGLIGWLASSHLCTQLSCYFGAKQSPFGYVYHNFLLKINQNSIAGTPTGSRAPLDWNGSLWTLYYEFICYIILLLLALIGLLKHRGVVLAVTVALMCAIAGVTLDSALRSHFSPFENWIPMNIMKFAAIFLVGTLICLYRDTIPDSGWLALGCAALFVAFLWLPRFGLAPVYGFTPSDFFAPALAYPLLWLGAHLPFETIGARNDYSYGMYIYAFPVQQLLAIWGVIRLGLPIYLIASVALTFPFAVASWWVVEKRALNLKALKFPLRRSLM